MRCFIYIPQLTRGVMDNTFSYIERDTILAEADGDATIEAAINACSGLLPADKELIPNDEMEGKIEAFLACLNGATVRLS